MIFENLADRLQETFKKLKGHGKISPQVVDETMREIKIALLEADVNFKVVKDFIKNIKERATGQSVIESLTPAQAVIKIVNEELTNLMGQTKSGIAISPKPPTIIMMVGLQGAGKTTSAGKLALNFKKDGKNPVLVAADIYRPAAIKQLQVLGKQINVPVFSIDNEKNATKIAKEGLDYALSHANDIVIIDTAGRLHVDELLMDELKNIKSAINPHEILLVVDAMTGQDVVNVAESFNGALGIDGVILTKMDGDARGGAALSVKAVTGCPIKFVGSGEKLEALEVFHPDRMASRILGMGDMLSLIEKAQENFDQNEAKKMEKAIRRNEFTFDDFLKQISQIKKLGSMDNIMGMIPGLAGMRKKMGNLSDLELDGKEIKHIEAIIRAMTPKERLNSKIINGSRRKRIAKGSGTSIQEVNRLLKQFEEMKKMMKKMANMQNPNKKGKKGKFKFPFF